MKRYAASTGPKTNLTGVRSLTAHLAGRIVPVVGMTTAIRMSTFRRLARARVVALPIQRSLELSRGTTVWRELCIIVILPRNVADWASALTWRGVMASHGVSHHAGQPTIRIRWSRRSSGQSDMFPGFGNIERPINALRRSRASRPGCNRMLLRGGSLSFSRSARNESARSSN
jgi:hypothetical protein